MEKLSHLEVEPHIPTTTGTDLELSWHDEFGRLDSDEHVHPTEDEDGQDDGEVTDELPHLREANRRTQLFSSAVLRSRWNLICFLHR